MKKRQLLSFTDRTIEGLPPSPGPGPAYYNDAGCKGLRLEVSTSGNKQFFARLRVKGKLKRFTPGSWPAVRTRQARAWMDGLRADVKRRLPVADVAAGQMTCDEYFRQVFYPKHLEVYAARSARSEWSLWWKHVSPAIGAARVGEVERADIVELHQAVHRAVSGRTANRAKRLAHTMFNHMIDNGFLITGNPAARIRNMEERLTGRWIMPHEIGPWLAAVLSDETERHVRDYIIISMFTGARMANVLGMRRSHIIPGLPTWRIDAAEFKGKRPHFVPLVRQVVAVVEARAMDFPGDQVFPPMRADNTRGHMAKPVRGWEDCVARSGLDWVKRHEMRDTISTWLQEAGVPDSIRAMFLGHKEGGVLSRYSHAQMETVLRRVQPVVDDMIATAGCAQHQLLRGA